MSVSDHFVVTRSSLRDHLFSMVRTWETSDICIQLDWIPNKSTVQHSDENDGSGCYKIQSVSYSKVKKLIFNIELFWKMLMLSIQWKHKSESFIKRTLVYLLWLVNSQSSVAKIQHRIGNFCGMKWQVCKINADVYNHFAVQNKET